MGRRHGRTEGRGRERTVKERQDRQGKKEGRKGKEGRKITERDEGRVKWKRGMVLEQRDGRR